MTEAEAVCSSLAAAIAAATTRARDELSSTGSVQTSTLGSLIGGIRAICLSHQLSRVKDVDNLARKSFMRASVRDAWEALVQAIEGGISQRAKGVFVLNFGGFVYWRLFFVMQCNYFPYFGSMGCPAVSHRPSVT
jgi:hypothetical protein